MAVKEESWNSTQLPSEMHQNKLGVCDNKFSKLPVPGKFMKMKEVLEVLRNTEKGFESVPPGKRENVFCVIKDSKNALRRAKNLPIRYNDASKKWINKGNYVSYVKYIEGKVTQLKVKDNLIYMPLNTRNKASCMLLNPQPDLKSLIKISRYYTDLKSDDIHKRRITAVSGEGFTDTALFEYCTKKANRHSNTGVFGTNKELTCRSVEPRTQDELDLCDRTSFEYCDTITAQHTIHERCTKAKKYKCSSPKLPVDEAYEETLEHNEQDAPRNKQTPHTTIKIQQEVSKFHEDLIMITMLEENPSVQAVISRKNKPPCVILYNDKQFSDMKRNLECGSVLGIDCSYKLGDCYATITVYQNSRALHKETNEPLLYLGPVFLHWDDEFLTYMSFFSHVMDKLEDIEPNFEVKLGNALEFSLFRALKHSFPTSVHMVNSHHLKNLVHRHLVDVADCKLKTQSTILQKIFGPTGIVSSPNLSAFQNRVLDVECYFDEIPSLKTYFHELQLFLYPYVCEPQQRGISQKLWANGNDEVLNDLLNTFLKHKNQKLPDIVEKICTIARLQMLKLDNVC